MEKGIFIYPWDVLDNGITVIAKELRRLGIGFVSMAVAYHQAKVLLPHNPKRRIFTHNSGSVYFPFDEREYGLLKPMMGEALNNYEGIFLKDVADEFHGHGIEVNAWTVVFHNSRLAREHPECAIHNAYGEPSPNSLCPSNDETFRYGLKMLADIASAGVDGINTESVDYAGLIHGDHHEMYAYENTPVMEELLGTCFCDSCRKRADQAGLDSGMLQRKIIDVTEKFLRLEAVDLDRIGEILEMYRSVQRNRINDFYIELRKRIADRNHKTSIVPIAWLTGGSNPRQYGMDYGVISGITDGIIAAYPASPEEVPQFASVVREIAPAAREIVGGVRLMAPQTTRLSQVREYMKAYRAAGIEKMMFYNYGLTPRPYLEEIAEVCSNG